MLVLNNREIQLKIIVISLIIIGTLFPLANLLALGCVGVSLIKRNVRSNVLLLYFILPFAQIFKILSITSMSFFTISEIVFAIVLLVKKGQYVSRRYIYGALLLVLILFDAAQVTVGIKICVSIILFAVSVEEDVQYYEVVKNFTAGILLSSIISFFFYDSLRISTYIEKVYSGGFSNQVFRFSGLYSDPNYYTVNLLLCIIGLFMMKFNNKIKMWFYPLLISLILFGASTGSKSFLLMLVCVILLYSIIAVRSSNYFDAGIAIICASIALILTLNGTIDVFSKILGRLDTSSFNALTTNRSELWVEYFNYIIHSPKVLWFGLGVGAPLMGSHGPHNTYIDLLYYLGILRGGFLILFIIAKFKSLKCKINSSGIFSLICLGAMYFSLSELFFYDFPFHLMIVAFAMKVGKDEINEL